MEGLKVVKCCEVAGHCDLWVQAGWERALVCVCVCVCVRAWMGECAYGWARESVQKRRCVCACVRARVNKYKQICRRCTEPPSSHLQGFSFDSHTNTLLTLTPNYPSVITHLICAPSKWSDYHWKYLDCAFLPLFLPPYICCASSEWLVVTFHPVTDTTFADKAQTLHTVQTFENLR